jgi:hypothetical protein
MDEMYFTHVQSVATLVDGRRAVKFGLILGARPAFEAVVEIY